MNSSGLLRSVGLLALIAGLAGASAGAAVVRSTTVKSDLVSPEKRRETVELGNRLARPEPAEFPPASADLQSPFNPPGFDKPDPEEQRGLATAQAAGNAAPKVATAREILETIAARIQPSGTSVFAGKPILFFRQKMLKVGDRLTIHL